MAEFNEKINTENEQDKQQETEKEQIERGLNQTGESLIVIEQNTDLSIEENKKIIKEKFDKFIYWLKATGEDISYFVLAIHHLIDIFLKAKNDKVSETAFEILKKEFSGVDLPLIADIFLKQVSEIRISNSDDDNFKEKVLKTRELLEQGLSNDISFADSAMVLKKILKSNEDDKEIYEWVLSAFNRNLDILKNNLKNENKENFKASVEILSFLLNFGENNLIEKSIQIICDYLNEFGLPSAKIFTAWMDSFSSAWKNQDSFSRRDHFSKIINGNLETLKTAENLKPGISKVLFEEYGITNFGRYPIETLISQYEEKDNKESKYGIIIFPESDWNGCFYNQTKIIRKTINRLKEKNILTRVVECKSIVRIYNYLDKFNKKYNRGGDNKILYAIIGGHGSPNSITFGEKGAEKIRRLTKPIFLDLTRRQKFHELKSSKIKKGMAKTKLFFDKESPITLFSCSTGVPSGIGQLASKFMNRVVSGPREDASPQDINISFDNKSVPRFKINYVDDIREVKEEFYERGSLKS